MKMKPQTKNPGSQNNINTIACDEYKIIRNRINNNEIK